MPSAQTLFFSTPATDSLAQWLSEQTDRPLKDILENLFLGSIYLDGHRLLKDQPVTAGGQVRFHTRPKRFPAVTQFSGSPSRLILAEHEDFYVLQKPAGWPTHATLDNRRENLLFQMESAVTEKLYPVQRLDIETSGLCLLGRRSGFQKQFHRLLQHSKVEKIYWAKILPGLQSGEHRHFMKKNLRPPHSLFEHDGDGRKECRLEILEVKTRDEFSSVKIRLLTGRTHQIRAQLSYLGFPLCGDSLYGSTLPGPFSLHASELTFTYMGSTYSFESSPPWL